ncbi:acetoacetate decarboxylase family protein [Acinetobacter haemolyticus]|uniref:acetoacetate decarboxylase n=1 Tax=Acinetobacter haemolyticus TaxID=29430 RepID=UPI000DE9A14B|nr:acetoacetate decarboxylase [Acinetobacter haemolyticus]WHR57959.1 acetoacetate decarboxylase [Acinetobacter haemolyticus]
MFNQVKFRRSASAASIGVFLSLSAHATTPNITTSNVENNDQQTTIVEFGPYKVHVPKGGYYDRFRMNPDLDEVAKDPAAGNIDYFRTIPKKMVETRVGKVWSPNFYYRTSNVQLLMLAPVSKLKAKLPAPLEPLQPFPGYGLVSLTFFSYAVGDVDPYDEVSVAVVVRQPGAHKFHTTELLSSMRNHKYYGHVLALPVDTEIARVRGVYGYQLPKWLTAIDMTIGNKNVEAEIFNTDGKPDVSLTAPLPKIKHVKPQSHIETKTMFNLVDGQWHSTSVESNTLAFGQQLFPRNVKLVRNGGPITKLLDELGAGKVLRLDVVKDAQLALNMPIPLKSLGNESNKK